jgi:hypothetical protein
METVRTERRAKKKRMVKMNVRRLKRRCSRRVDKKGRGRGPSTIPEWRLTARSNFRKKEKGVLTP